MSLVKQKNKPLSYSTINLFVRSSLVWLFSVIVIPMYYVTLLCNTFSSLQVRQRIIRHFLRSYLYVLKTVCHIDYVVEGLQHIPKNSSGIILCKHQSTWETFFLPTIFYDPAIIVKKELLRVPFFGWGMALMEPIGIDRNKTASAMQQIINQGKKCLDEGRWVIVFPEGTRVPVGTVGHYKLGGARLAEATGYPVIPVAHNAGRYWPRGKFIKRPGTVKIVIGPCIDVKGRKAGEILALAKDWIEMTVTRLDRA